MLSAGPCSLFPVGANPTSFLPITTSLLLWILTHSRYHTIISVSFVIEVLTTVTFCFCRLSLLTGSPSDRARTPVCSCPSSIALPHGG